MTNNEVAIVNQALPDYMAGDSAHKEDINLQLLQIPTIKAGNPTSQEVTSGKVKYGELYSSLGETFGTEIELVVVKPFVNYVKFEDGKLVGRSSNPNIWEEGDLAGQEIDKDLRYRYERYNFYVIHTNATDPIPYVVSLYSTAGAKEGKKLFKILGTRAAKFNEACYCRTYKFSVTKEKNDLGQYAAWHIDATEQPTPKAIYILAKESRKYLDENATLISHDEPTTANRQSVEPTAPATEVKTEY